LGAEEALLISTSRTNERERSAAPEKRESRQEGRVNKSEETLITEIKALPIFMDVKSLNILQIRKNGALRRERRVIRGAKKYGGPREPRHHLYQKDSIKDCQSSPPEKRQTYEGKTGGP